jgi:hypothetical protein
MYLFIYFPYFSVPTLDWTTADYCVPSHAPHIPPLVLRASSFTLSHSVEAELSCSYLLDGRSLCVPVG